MELEKQRAAAIEAERKRREEEAKCQRDLLVAMSRDFREASDLRAFVDSVGASAVLPEADFAIWSAWAHSIADRIDPLKNPTTLAQFATAKPVPSAGPSAMEC